MIRPRFVCILHVIRDSLDTARDFRQRKMMQKQDAFLCRHLLLYNKLRQNCKGNDTKKPLSPKIALFHKKRRQKAVLFGIF